ncbi:hypothetical protein PAL_GLEAN10008153 [Pteropus alecto]|uniref:Uncharacterized protein n=1 Tax=Pteropus alecto TaxID=9402 RepID=L5K070_PTEAL|nr:hypothetical protein PAL_GLEAN10008153 [Pteropus alecto]
MASTCEEWTPSLTFLRQVSRSLHLLPHLQPPGGQFHGQVPLPFQVQNLASPQLPRLSPPRHSEPSDRHRLTGTVVTARASVLCLPEPVTLLPSVTAETRI